MDVVDTSSGGQQQRELRFIPQRTAAPQPESAPLLQLPTRSPASSSAELLHITRLIKRPLSIRVNEYVEPNACLLPATAPKTLSKAAGALTPLSSASHGSSSPAPDVFDSSAPVSAACLGRLADGCVFYDGSSERKNLPPHRPGHRRPDEGGSGVRDGGGSGQLPSPPLPLSPPPPPPPQLRYPSRGSGSSGDGNRLRPGDGVNMRASGAAALPDALLVIISEQPASVSSLTGDRARLSSGGRAARADSSVFPRSSSSKAPPAHEAAAERPATAAVADSSIVCARCGKCQCRACTQTRCLPEWSIPAPRQLVAAVAAASPFAAREPAERPFLPAERRRQWQSATDAAADEGSLVCSDECCVDAASCLCCVRAMFNGGCCGGEADRKLATGTAPDAHPCACRDKPMCCARWSVLLMLATTVLPCLCFYWPLRACAAAVSGCYNCHRKRHGCHCRSGGGLSGVRVACSGLSAAEEAVIKAVDGSEQTCPPRRDGCYGI